LKLLKGNRLEPVFKCILYCLGIYFFGWDFLW